jgi:hypothetical protein
MRFLKSKKSSKNKKVAFRWMGKLSKVQMAIFVAIFAILGAYFILQSHAYSGVAPGMDADLTWGVSSGDISNEVNLMKQAGVQWTRTSCSWAQVERRQGRYNWGPCDSGIVAANNGKINVVVNLVDAPSWAQTGYQNTNYPPTSDHYGNFAAFAAAAANHYKGMGIHSFEIWNEQNAGGRFWPSRDPGGYTAMLKQAYSAIHGADGSARVIYGGLSGNDTGFVNDSYNAGLHGYFDTMALHPYNANQDPYTGDFGNYRNVFASMQAHGDGNKKIWLTEFGWSSCTGGGWCVGEAAQANYLQKAYTFMNNDGCGCVEVAFWYNFRNDYWLNNANDWEPQLGLLRTDYSAKPAYNTYKGIFHDGTISLQKPAPPPAGPAWSTNWENLGGGLNSGLSISSWGSNRLDAFGRGTNDRALWHGWWDGSRWQWESLHGCLSSSPGSASWGPGRIDVFVRGCDNALWHIWFNGSNWSSWEPQGGQLSSAPAVASWGANRLDVFATDNLGRVWHHWYDNGWGGWDNLLGNVPSGQPAAVSWGPGRIDLFGKGGDGALWHKWWNGTAWSGWESQGGILTSAPTVSSWGSGRLDVFVRGVDYKLYHKWFDNGQWSTPPTGNWEDLGGCLSSEPAAASWGRGRIDVVALGCDNPPNIWHRWFQ